MIALLAGCFGPADGNDMAWDRAGQLAEELADNYGYINRPGQAEWIAAEAPLPDTGGSYWESTIEFLDWSGQLAHPGDEVTLDLRFTVTVRDSGRDYFGDYRHTGGRAVRCFRLHLPLFGHATHEEIECPPGATARQPNRAPGMPADARARIEAVLAEATPESLDDQMRAAFPEPHVTVSTTVHQGTLVVAVGVTRERACILVIRTPEGEIRYPGYDREWSQPGEQGCSTGLYTSRPQ